MNRPRTTGGRRITFAALLLFTLGLLGSSVAGQSTAQGATHSLELREVGSFTSPVYAATAPGKANRKLLFVVEQGGTVRVLRGRKTLRQPFLDISGQISSGGERGLLSIAFDRRYAKNRRLYAYFTDPQGDIRVEQFRRSKKRKTRASSRGRLVIEVPHREAGNHNGGTVIAGDDGLLYIGTGDGGGGCDPSNNSQDLNSLLGKMLRVKPKPKGGYSVPRRIGNPFKGLPGRDEILATGLRNPYRFSSDPELGWLIADVGQNTLEEINFVTEAGLVGANFGWDAFEGTERSAVSGCNDTSPRPDDHTEPVHEYGHGGPGHTGCSVTGGLVVRDPRLGQLAGRYIYADFCTGDIRSFVPELQAGQERARDERSTGATISTPTSFVEGPGGRVYATSLSGSVSRLKPR